MSGYPKYYLYSTLPVAVLFIIVALIISPSVEKFSGPQNSFQLAFLLIFGSVALLDIFYFAPKFMKENILPANSREVVMKHALLPLTLTNMPLVFGFVAYFMSGSWLYFGAFILLGLVSWLYFYRKIESKLNQVQ